MIREATKDDVPMLVEMGRKFHSLSPHKPMGEFDGEAVTRMLVFMIGEPRALVLTNGSGAIGGITAPVYFNPSKIMMEESFWWAEKDGVELLREFEIRSKDYGADFLMLSTLENDRAAAIDRVVKGLGYGPIERRYMKEVSQ